MLFSSWSEESEGRRSGLFRTELPSAFDVTYSAALGGREPPAFHLAHQAAVHALVFQGGFLHHDLGQVTDRADRITHHYCARKLRTALECLLVAGEQIVLAMLGDPADDLHGHGTQNDDLFQLDRGSGCGRQ